MGCLVHIGFFIISPYPRYSVSPLCYLPLSMHTTRSHFSRYQHTETEIDKILNTWKSVASVATYLSRGKSKMSLSIPFFLHFLFHPFHFHSVFPPFHGWRFRFEVLFKAAQFLRQKIRKNLALAYSLLSFIAKDLYRVNGPFKSRVMSQ